MSTQNVDAIYFHGMLGNCYQTTLCHPETIIFKYIICKYAGFNEQYNNLLLSSGRIIRKIPESYSDLCAIAVTCCIIEPLLEEQQLGFLLYD